MDYRKWIDVDWTKAPMSQFNEFQGAMMADMESRLEPTGIKVLKVLPNVYSFGVVCTDTEGGRFINVTIPDVRQQPDWIDHIRLRRMSSERDWKGDAFHYCTWDELEGALAKYLGAEYDDEVL